MNLKYFACLPPSNCLALSGLNTKHQSTTSATLPQNGSYSSLQLVRADRYPLPCLLYIPHVVDRGEKRTLDVVRSTRTPAQQQHPSSSQSTVRYTCCYYSHQHQHNTRKVLLYIPYHTLLALQCLCSIVQLFISFKPLRACCFATKRLKS